MLWFAKYLLYAASRGGQTILEDSPTLQGFKIGTGTTERWPVQPWNDKGSRKTYTDLDYEFFFKTRQEICVAHDLDKATHGDEVEKYFMSFPKELPSSFYFTTQEEGSQDLEADNNSQGSQSTDPEVGASPTSSTAVDPVPWDAQNN